MRESCVGLGVSAVFTPKDYMLTDILAQIVHRIRVSHHLRDLDTAAVDGSG